MERLDIQSFTTDPICITEPIGRSVVSLSRADPQHPIFRMPETEKSIIFCALWANHRPDFFPKVFWLLWLQGSKSHGAKHTSSIPVNHPVPHLAPDWKGDSGASFGCVWKCCVPLNPMVLLIIIPIKWLFHWEYTLFSDKPICPTVWKGVYKKPAGFVGWIWILHAWWQWCVMTDDWHGTLSQILSRASVQSWPTLDTQPAPNVLFLSLFHGCKIRHYHRDQIIVILILSMDHHSLRYHHDSFQPWTPNDPRVLQRAPGTAGPKRHNARCLTDWLHTRPVSQTMWATDRLLLETKTNMKYVVDIIGYLWWWCRQATKPSTKNKFGILPYPLCK